MCTRPVDLAGLWQESSEVLASVVPYFWTACFYILDPASLLVTSHYHGGLPEFPAEWLAAEYYHDDVNRLAGPRWPRASPGSLQSRRPA